MFRDRSGPFLMVFRSDVARLFDRNMVELQTKPNMKALQYADVCVDLGTNEIVKDRFGYSTAEEAVKHYGVFL